MKLDLTSFRRALDTLDRGLTRRSEAPADEEVRDACIQRFEVSFELTWKMLKRRLMLDLAHADEVDGMTFAL